MKSLFLVFLLASLNLFANEGFTKSLKANEWYIVSFPVEQETDLSTLFSSEANGADLFFYNNQKSDWDYTHLECENDNCKANGSFTTLNMLEGFWIKPKIDFELKYCKNGTPIVVNENLSNEVLSNEQKYALAYMWHEEKLARDIYLELYKVQPAKQLYNIATKSEVVHINLVEQLISSYDINITNLKDYKINYSKEELSSMEVGKFVIADIQNLYDELKDRGSKSIQSALEVGCLVEVTDVNDLNKYIEITKDKAEIVEVFEKLRTDSYHHYWAFDTGLKNIGVSNGCCSLGSEYCKIKEEYPSSEKM